MGTLKSFAALLLSVAALLTSVLALNAAQKKAEMQKAAAQTVTKAVVAAQEETALASALDSDTCEAKLLGTQVLNTEVGTLDATVSTAGPLGAIEAKLKPEKEESEEKKPDGTAQESAQERIASRSILARIDQTYPVIDVKAQRITVFNADHAARLVLDRIVDRVDQQLGLAGALGPHHNVNHRPFLLCAFSPFYQVSGENTSAADRKIMKKQKTLFQFPK